jgi:hypothetical protein
VKIELRVIDVLFAIAIAVIVYFSFFRKQQPSGDLGFSKGRPDTTVVNVTNNYYSTNPIAKETFAPDAKQSLQTDDSIRVYDSTFVSKNASVNVRDSVRGHLLKQSIKLNYDRLEISRTDTFRIKPNPFCIIGTTGFDPTGRIFLGIQGQYERNGKIYVVGHDFLQRTNTVGFGIRF